MDHQLLRNEEVNDRYHTRLIVLWLCLNRLGLNGQAPDALWLRGDQSDTPLSNPRFLSIWPSDDIGGIVMVRLQDYPREFLLG